MTRLITKTLPSALKSAKTSAVLFAIAATSAIAPSAFASNMVETKLTVKIASSDLADADGIQKAYEKMEKKATAFCKGEKDTLFYLNETVDDCVQDLMDQFIATSGETRLKAYHTKMAEVAAPKKLAMH